jgi:putative chitinase
LPAYLATLTQSSASAVFDSAGISKSPRRVCHFLAQIMTETGALRHESENLDYRASTLVRLWPRHFKTLDEAQPYAHNPTRLAEFIYGQGSIAGQLGNKIPLDGWSYRGRGLIQITGRGAYGRVGTLVGVDLINQPDLAFSSTYALHVACAEWINSRHDGKSCNTLADEDDIAGVTYAINGGQNGLADRELWLKRAKAIWGAVNGASAPASRGVAFAATGRTDLD